MPVDILLGGRIIRIANSRHLSDEDAVSDRTPELADSEQRPNRLRIPALLRFAGLYASAAQAFRNSCRFDLGVDTYLTYLPCHHPRYEQPRIPSPHHR